MSESSKRHKAEAPRRLGFALIMCSTSRFKHLNEGRRVEDPSGDLIAETVDGQHKIVSRVLVPDDEMMIRDSVHQALQKDEVDIVIVCGGTGVAPKDVTIETVTPMFTKELPGFGELFRKLSYDTIGAATVLSRATAGTSKGKAIFCIPGSPDAVRLCLHKIILPEAGHIVKHTREK